MKQNHYIRTMAIEVTGIILVSGLSLFICKVAEFAQWGHPIVFAFFYAVLKLMLMYFHKCQRHLSNKTLEEVYDTDNSPQSTAQSKEEILRKRMELFHHEYNLEQQEYLQQKEKEDDLKLNRILKYTRDTFKHLGFDEVEVFRLCECVRYFVANRQVLSNAEINIRKRNDVTQISLKNFAWNIAFQYGIPGELTTDFVMKTFREWFANSTFDTVRKNLRTTTGRHQIEIDEHII